jgi:hypothetical protein
MKAKGAGEERTDESIRRTVSLALEIGIGNINLAGNIPHTHGTSRTRGQHIIN